MDTIAPNAFLSGFASRSKGGSNSGIDKSISSIEVMLWSRIGSLLQFIIVDRVIIISAFLVLCVLREAVLFVRLQRRKGY